MCVCETGIDITLPTVCDTDYVALHKGERGWWMAFDNTLRNTDHPRGEIICGGIDIKFCPLCGRKLDEK